MKAIEILTIAVMAVVLITLGARLYVKHVECEAARGVLIQGTFGAECVKLERAK